MTTSVCASVGLILLFIVVDGANNDLWNYGYTTYNDGRISYGQPNWNAITCEDPLTCVSLYSLCDFRVVIQHGQLTDSTRLTSISSHSFRLGFPKSIHILPITSAILLIIVGVRKAVTIMHVDCIGNHPST